MLSSRRLGAALTAFSLVAHAGVASGAPRYDVCRDQIVTFVEGRLGQRVTGIEFDFDYEDRPRLFTSLTSFGNQAVVYTDACEGYHVFDVHATHVDCEQRAHYGTPPNYIRYRTSSGACKKSLD